MSRIIKVTDEVYKRLDQIRGEERTFSQAIAQLLALRGKIFFLFGDIEGPLNYRDWLEDRRREDRARQEER